jgi:hypothetical protein
MIKEFSINDILNAVDIISKSKQKKNFATKIEKNSIQNSSNLTAKNQAKPNKGEILVLDEMIE